MMMFMMMLRFTVVDKVHSRDGDYGGINADGNGPVEVDPPKRWGQHTQTNVE